MSRPCHLCEAGLLPSVACATGFLAATEIWWAVCGGVDTCSKQADIACPVPPWDSVGKCVCVQDAAKSANWQSIMRRPLFAEPRGAASATLQHLCRIFAARHDELWKAPDVLAWLLRCAEAAADAADASAAGTAAPQVHPSQVPVADAHTLIGLTYPESQENEYAHCVVSDYTDTVAAVPPEQMAAMGAAGGEVPAELEQMAEAYARNFIQQSGMVRAALCTPYMVL